MEGGVNFTRRRSEQSPLDPTGERVGRWSGMRCVICVRNTARRPFDDIYATIGEKCRGHRQPQQPI